MSKSEKKAVAVTTQTDSKRRNFLIGAGLGGAAAAAAVAGSVTGVQPATETKAEPVADSKGYKETEHIRRYYGTTRI